jgi:hypothetical protein
MDVHLLKGGGKKKGRKQGPKANGHPHPLRSVFINPSEGIGEREHATTIHSSKLHLLHNYYKPG